MSDWIDMIGVGTDPQVKRAKEYAVEYHNGVIDHRSPNEGMAMTAAQDLRRSLNSMGVPELYWPVVVEREVALSAGPWFGRNE